MSDIVIIVIAFTGVFAFLTFVKVFKMSEKLEEIKEELELLKK